jgi:hypothetical protein
MRLSIIFIVYLIINAAPVAAQEQALIPFEHDEKWGYKNKNGNVVIESVYFLADSFNTHGIAAVVDDSGWVYINKKGISILRPFIYDNGPDYFSEGLARYVSDNNIGFFDEKGSIIIPARFSFVLPFSEEMAAFCEGCKEIKDGEHSRMVGGKWGYIDKSGKVVVNAIYNRVGKFEGSKARVEDESGSYYIDKKGNRVR